MLTKKIRKAVLTAQKNEISEYHIYSNLAFSGDPHNRKIVQRIAGDELKHYNFWKKISGVNIKPDRLKIFKYGMIAKIFGITFATKIMERGEGQAQVSYKRISEFIPGVASIMHDEEKHEQELIALIEEERLKYVSSMVLGLNDALVELTGALAGFSLVFVKAKLIAVVGLVTGVAAAFSMAGAEYLSQKSEDDKSKSPLLASVYTGIVYLCTVFILILPYLIFSNPLFCIAIVIACAVLIIWIFTYYISVAMDKPFRERFVEMLIISLGVAVLSFGVGYLVRVLFNIQT